MSKYTQKPFTAEEKRKAVEQFAEKITYSARYASKSIQAWHLLASMYRAHTPDEDFEYRLAERARVVITLHLAHTTDMLSCLNSYSASVPPGYARKTHGVH
jgi:hypothetical protein